MKKVYALVIGFLFVVVACLHIAFADVSNPGGDTIDLILGQGNDMKGLTQSNGTFEGTFEGDGGSVTGVNALTVGNLLSETIVTNIESIVLSNFFRIVRLANNRYEIHVETNAVVVDGAVSLFVSASTNLPIPSLTDTVVKFDAELFDTANIYDNTTGIIKFSKVGKWRVAPVVRIASTFADGKLNAVRINTNGTIFIVLDIGNTSNTADARTYSGSVLLDVTDTNLQYTIGFNNGDTVTRDLIGASANFQTFLSIDFYSD